MKNRETDLLLPVLKAAAERKQIPSPNSDSRVTLFFSRTLGPEDAGQFRALQNYLRTEYELDLRVVGGGFGCTKFDVDLGTPDNVVRLFELLENNPAAKSMFLQLGGNVRLSATGTPGCDIKNQEEVAGGRVAFQNALGLVLPSAKSRKLTELILNSREDLTQEGLVRVASGFSDSLKSVALVDAGVLSRVTQRVAELLKSWREDTCSSQAEHECRGAVEEFIKACDGKSYPTVVRKAKELSETLDHVLAMVNANADI